MSTRTTTRAAPVWTNASVKRLAGDADPVEAMQQRARRMVLEAQEHGWSGPPFDPFELAALLKLKVAPRSDIPDARTVPLSDGGLEIEYNPNRPAARVRFSLAHEIAHTLFPDCAETIRNRSKADLAASDEWQLETLCNIGAAELLMPVGSLPNSAVSKIGIDQVLELRAKFDVSTEAILLRLARVTDSPCAVFAASRVEEGKDAGRYRIDYARLAGGFTARLPAGALLPASTVLAECTAIGFTAKRSEAWPQVGSTVRVEALGIPPFPGRVFPRVVGVLVNPTSPDSARPKIEYLSGDATAPRGQGRKIIAQVVNDRTPRWGAGFALAIARKYPEAQSEFIAWAGLDRNNLKLGKCHVTPIGDGTVEVYHIVAQHGYGPSKQPRIRYEALETGLAEVGAHALRVGATVHMPRIGCGEAGGTWGVVEELISEHLLHQHVRVTVYDLPNKKAVSVTKENTLFGPR